MSEGRDLVKDAVNDAKAMRTAAVEAAKAQLVEGLTPAIKVIVEKALRGAVGNEDLDRLRRGIQDKYPGESHTGFEEAKGKGDQTMDQDKKTPDGLDLESIAAMFPQLSEDPGLAADAAGIPTLGEDGSDDPFKGQGEDGAAWHFATASDDGKKGSDGPPKPKENEGRHAAADGSRDEDGSAVPAVPDEKREGAEPQSEEIEISEAELNKVYESALQTEATVKKNFGDMTKFGTLADVDPGAGIADVKKGESGWHEKGALPPDKKDWVIKEMKELLTKGLAENKVLRERLGKAVEMIRALGGKLHEVNLFNSKVLHVNRILNSAGRLTTEHKRVVMESIDKARTIDEVRTIYETLVASFKVAQSINESRKPGSKPSASAQRARTSGAADQKVLSESVDKQSEKTDYGRMRQLAGLVNGSK